MKTILALLLSIAALTANAEQMWINILGPQNVTIKRNQQEYGPLAVQPDLVAFNIMATADDWPNAQLVTVTIYASFDGGQTWPHSTTITTNRPPLDKAGNQSPVQIGIGWNHEVRQATHVRATTNNPGPGFSSTVLIEALTAF